MQLNVFSTDNNKSGFRLQYMELFNWGTFDNEVHTIRPLGETSLLTGPNGSGKTTFVDALLTLIVPEKKYRFYNQSSGSDKKGDRTEESYVLGGFGTMNTESTGTLRTQYLREDKDQAYSILLAHFANEAEQFVSLFQVRYFSGGEMRKIFAIAYKPLCIANDLKPFDLSGNWKRALDARYNKGSRKYVEWFDAASKYAQRLVDALGMQSIQALQLFNQTVGIKVLGNLDEFIRTHMLEPRNIEDSFQELKRHLATLLDAQRNIEKVEEQIRLLVPIKEHHDKYASLQKSILELQRELQTGTIWHAFTTDQLLTDEIENLEDALKNFKQKVSVAKLGLEKVHEEERIIKNQIDQNKAGQRLQQLEKEIQLLVEQKEKAATEYTLFSGWCNEIGLQDQQPADETTYARITKEAHRKSLELSTKQRNNEEDEYDAKKTIEEKSKETKELENEINTLIHNKGNIPGYLVNLRALLCDQLNIEISELPFSGELIQVKSDQIIWQPALEKLLYSFSLRLLVPDKYYKKVSRYVNNNNLRARLVYEHLTEMLNQTSEEGMISDKIEFHPEHKLAQWVEQYVISHFDYACIEDEKALERYGKAITINGLIKNRSKHEKDDRPQKSDPSRYVMGWNNERKKEALMRHRDALVSMITSANQKLNTSKIKASKLKARLYAAQRIVDFPGYIQLDVSGKQRAIHKLQEQVEQLRKENKDLDVLKGHLHVIQQQKNDLINVQQKLIGEEALTSKERENLFARKIALQPLLVHIIAQDKGELVVFQQKHTQLISATTLDNIDNKYAAFKTERETKLEGFKSSSLEEEKTLTKFITRVKNPPFSLMNKFPDWGGDVQQLPDDVTYAKEYIEWLDKLETDNLPRHKKAFENYINETITYKIGGLNEELERWERDITNSVKKLNDSLSAINFNRTPDTYIQLGKKHVQAGSEIRDFKGMLLEALPQAADWQQSNFESKSLHFTQKVQPLVDSLDESETYRGKVLDVRNWFEFWADERYRQTNELKKTYRQMGQLSGGEKAQLTYTILCSAIAYQFGITREGANSKSLRFIAVDESFSNQDEEKATYLMELCKQLHLQLLVVTPSDKIQIVQDFIAHVHLVQRVNNRHSTLYNMTIKELQEHISKVAN